ncbi:hypothetical protein HPP92_017164 [Vanilla planifolia]|uniref:Uncharacterized protein n=1 Tax=Vanilla planifolia TaxID=51239 RepID=A0A835QDK0_VANPL|nr:hypothetical protein HPP92_017164 [Vanilla planifolia]
MDHCSRSELNKLLPRLHSLETALSGICVLPSSCATILALSTAVISFIPYLCLPRLLLLHAMRGVLSLSRVLSLRRTAFLVGNLNLEKALGFRMFTTDANPKSGSKDQRSSNSDAYLSGGMQRIRIEFDEAKRNFCSVPSSLDKVPKMNPKGIYVNKNLRLDMVKVYGFDYDYTLAHYSTNLQSLIYDLAKDYLVGELKYPEKCSQFKYDPSFPIRGLYYDKMKGCLLKLDFFGSIEPDGCFFGRHKVSREKIKELYGTRHIGRDQVRGLVGLMDIFCFSEVCLIADIVQHFIDAKLDFDASYIYEDVRNAIQHVHRSGALHSQILLDPPRYLVRNSQVLKFITMLKEKGKKVFMLTNSPYQFVDGGMKFISEGYGAHGDSWRDLFDVVIAKANKPSFYTSEHPFRCYDIEKDRLAFTSVDRFLPDQVYYNGCLKEFLQITKWNGPEVIFFGDHLFSDLRGPSKAGWRTAAIIHELESEIQVQNTQAYRIQQAKFHKIQELLGKYHLTISRFDEQPCNALLRDLNYERTQCRLMMRKMFNSSFGATFLSDTGQESAFSYYIHQYADVYTSNPENFLLYPPEAWLHVPFDIKIMPHHVKESNRFEGRERSMDQRRRESGEFASCLVCALIPM